MCLQGSIAASDLVIYNLKANPKTSFGAIQSKMDSVQTHFYNLELWLKSASLAFV